MFKKKTKGFAELKPGEVMVGGNVPKETVEKVIENARNSERKYTHVHKTSFFHAIDILENALNCGQLGAFLNPENLSLAFVYAHNLNTGVYDQSVYMGKRYVTINELKDLTFKSKEELDAEEMQKLFDKINNLKQEIDNKSKELAVLAMKVRG